MKRTPGRGHRQPAPRPADAARRRQAERREAGPRGRAEGPARDPRRRQGAAQAGGHRAQIGRAHV